MDPGQLALLVKTEWQLSYVTPLHQFRHTQLKSYARQLSAFIAAGKQQGLAVEVEGLQTTFRVSFSLVQGMTQSDEDAESVLVQVCDVPRGVMVSIAPSRLLLFLTVSFWTIDPLKAAVCQAGRAAEASLERLADLHQRQPRLPARASKGLCLPAAVRLQRGRRTLRVGQVVVPAVLRLLLRPPGDQPH